MKKNLTFLFLFFFGAFMLYGQVYDPQEVLNRMPHKQQKAFQKKLERNMMQLPKMSIREGKEVESMGLV